MAKQAMIDAADFTSVKVEISLKNLTSQTIVSAKVIRIGDAEPSAPSVDNEIHLLEMAEDSVAISLPTHTASLGHRVELMFVVHNLRKRAFDFLLAGTIHEMEYSADGKIMAIVSLNPSSLEAWKDFSGLFSARQGAIDAFFKNVKGY